MEGKKVQSAVGNEDQVLGVEMFADWSDEFCAEGFQMAVGRVAESNGCSKR